MAKRKTGGGGFGAPTATRAYGSVRTAAGGTRARGGGLVAPTRARGSTARGSGLAAPARVITAPGTARGNRVLITPSGGGGTARGGLVRIKRTSNDPYRGSGTRRAKPARSAGRTRTVNRGSAVSDRRANAIRELVRRGATPGERAAARGAARRLGI